MRSGGLAGGGVSYFYLMLIASAVAILARRFRAVPYALALVITGLVLGAPGWFPTVHLQPHILFTIFLPPLLFEAAIQLDADALRREWRGIARLALGVTVVSTFVIGPLAAWGLRLPLSVAWVFGALISATDPISVIAVLRELRASARLTLLMETEALFNDGVAVVLFTVLSAAAVGSGGSHQGPISAFLGGIGLVLWSGIGGALIGALIGFVASRTVHHVDDHLVEITLTTIVAWGSYLAADAIHVSGVLAVIAGGLLVGNYGKTGMTPSTRAAVGGFWEYAAFVVNSVVFLLVGIEESRAGLLQALPFALTAALVVLAGRLAVYPISFLAGKIHGEHDTIPAGFQHVLVWGGLRGALSMALAMGLAPDFPFRAQVVTATFGAVLFSLLVQGLTIGPLLRRLKLTADSDNEKDNSHAPTNMPASHTL